MIASRSHSKKDKQCKDDDGIGKEGQFLAYAIEAYSENDNGIHRSGC